MRGRKPNKNLNRHQFASVTVQRQICQSFPIVSVVSSRNVLAMGSRLPIVTIVGAFQELGNLYRVLELQRNASLLEVHLRERAKWRDKSG